MTEGSITTYEEAKTCPKCGRVGEVRLSVPAKPDRDIKPGTKIEHVYCTTELCRWYNTPWLLQVNPDGTIPPPKNHRGEPKVYQGFEGHDEMANRIVANLKAQQQAEMRPGSEIKNPNS